LLTRTRDFSPVLPFPFFFEPPLLSSYARLSRICLNVLPPPFKLFLFCSTGGSQRVLSHKLPFPFFLKSSCHAPPGLPDPPLGLHQGAHLFPCFVRSGMTPVPHRPSQPNIWPNLFLPPLSLSRCRRRAPTGILIFSLPLKIRELGLGVKGKSFFCFLYPLVIPTLFLAVRDESSFFTCGGRRVGVSPVVLPPFFSRRTAASFFLHRATYFVFPQSYLFPVLVSMLGDSLLAVGLNPSFSLLHQSLCLAGFSTHIPASPPNRVRVNWITVILSPSSLGFFFFFNAGDRTAPHDMFESSPFSAVEGPSSRTVI